jgi:hypothetical protein
MTSRETLECMAREMAAEFRLPDEDWEAVLTQAQRTLDAIAQLDDLPLAAVEPAPVFQVDPERAGG